MTRAVLSIGNDYLYLDRRSDIELPYIQNKLSIAYNQRMQVICKCAHVPMYIKKYGRAYKIASYPYRANEHKSTCIFSDSAHYYSDDGKYYLGTIDLFTYSEELQKRVEKIEEREPYAGRTGTLHVKDQNRQDVEQHRIYKSFSNLMYDIVSDAYSWGFNYVNKGVERTESAKLKNPTLPLISNKVMEILMNDLVLPGRRDIRQVINNFMLQFYSGTILDYVVEEKYVICKSFGTSFFVDINLWEQASRELFIKNHSNIISPPYFYISLRKENRILKFWMCRNLDLI